MLKQNILLGLLCVMLIAVGCDADKKLERKATHYDELTGQLPVRSLDEIENVLSLFETQLYQNLPKSYLKYCDPNKEFDSSLRGKRFYQINGEDMFRFLVGRHRLLHFIPRDSFHHLAVKALPDSLPQYFLVNTLMLHKLLELQLSLEKNGHDMDAFRVRSGYRHPAYNQAIKGAKESKHILGEAVDLVIGDIDGNGRVEQADKAIVLQLLEQEIIRNIGGIGRYPGTMSIHFDVRGYAARWDSY